VKKEIFVSGVVRNVAEYLEKDVSRFYNALNRFDEIHWFFIESDSDDDTLKVLKKLSENYKNFNFKSLGRLRDNIKFRTERLALCRNVAMEQMIESKFYNKIDHIIMADFDGINDLICQKSFDSCFEQDFWDVCCANQLGPYYDIWALRHPFWSPNDCFESANFFKDYVGIRNSVYDNVIKRMIKIPVDSKWIQVNSAFGGVAIYKKDIIKESIHVGSVNGKEINDHVIFHEELVNKGYKIFINPKFINAKYTEHTKNFTPKISNLIKALYRNIRRKIEKSL